jgi:hypothetical protein
MKLSGTREDESMSTAQETPRILLNRQADYYVHSSFTLIHNLSQFKSIHILKTLFH